MTPYQQMLCVLQYHRVSSYTEACIELGVFDHLAEVDAMPIADLAERTGTHRRALERCLRGLAHFGLFSQIAPGQFALTEASYQLTSGSEFSIKPWHKLHRTLTPEDPRKKADIIALLQTGKSIFQIEHGCLFYDYLRDHQDIAALFDKAMESASRMEVRDILEGFDFSASTHLTEVAGGNGALISGVLQRNPGIQGQLFDLPDVVERFTPIPRLRTVGVDMHAALPAIPDDAMMKRILHSYSDERAANLLANVHRTMQPGSKLFVFELIDDPDVANPYIGTKHLQMLNVHGAPGASGGPGERTAAEFASLLGQAGFELAETRHLPSIDVVIALCR